MAYLNYRYLPPENLPDFREFETSLIGFSVENRPIKLYRIGRGHTKVFAWSQMHGNESTTTRALIKLIQDLREDELTKKNVSFYFILQLNPDGAYYYTRENANKVDLNRDAWDLSQPESNFLRSCFDKVNPDLCLNLHDQRSIFSAGNTKNEATISFLSPAGDVTKAFTEARRKAIYIINQLNTMLSDIIHGKVGRFDDSFNINCTGDLFTYMNKPTLLIEAGHYNLDYSRDLTTLIVHKSILKILEIVNDCPSASEEGIKYYLDIPQNEKYFFDILIRNISINNQKMDLGILFKEVLRNRHIHFEPYIANRGDLTNFWGHQEISDLGEGSYEIFNSVCGTFDVRNLE